MKKLRKLHLDAESLRVDTFATDAFAGDARGTVHGNSAIDTYSFGPKCHCVRETNPLYDCTYGCGPTPNDTCL
ncbi:MAG TPA: hypothetical protein VFQ39_04640 [Longimicrobium sp.]|nr:hypothetical protein [Longimicrobium sp.]